jgi:hypothetical protein
MAMIEEAKIHAGRVAAAGRLKDLGVDEATLREAVEYGLRHAFSCTKHDPPNLPGIIAWGKGIRSLRDRLVPGGWTADNSRNYATVVSSDGRVAIAVAAADAGTGRSDLTPTTRSTKGPATKRAVHRNQLSFADVVATFPKPQEASGADQTWLLLHYVDEEAEEIRSELSLPVHMDGNGYVDTWQERIILEPVPHIPEPLADAAAGEEIDVPVERRTEGR